MSEDRKDRIAALQGEFNIMEDYLLVKFRERDWHGVQDAASDLRDIESELKGLRLE